MPSTMSAPMLQLKGSAFTFTVLELAGTDSQAFAQELAQRVGQAGTLLRNAPVVLALDKLADAAGPLDLATLLDTCRRHTLHPVGVHARRPDDITQAAALGLALLPTRGRERDSAADNTRKAPRSTQVVTQPVRGGQQIHAAGDLVLLAPVSAGAEVLADGHIHAWAPLRGRALAGVQGDTGARIFCRELDAELVAIAGHYRIADDLKAHELWGKGAQLLLQDDELRLLPL